MIIFDLDGTIADCEHRRHFVHHGSACDTGKYEYVGYEEDCPIYLIDKITKNKWKPDWKAFYEACDKDAPIEATITCLNVLLSTRCEIEIWSGRCESVRVKTCDWICKNIFNTDQLNPNSMLKMRPIGNTEPDEVLKERWLNEYLDQFPSRLGHHEVHASNYIDFVFDDRPKVIRMWRRRGIFVFSCAQEDNEF